MKIELLVVGKTSDTYINTGIDNYVSRLKHYIPFQITEIKDLKNTKKLSEQQIKQKEGELIMKLIVPGDWVILLDERGKQKTSIEFSSQISDYMLRGLKKAIFIIGGPYGFSDEVYARANEKISLSKMTFSHQMVRLFFVEQLYRAMTIRKGEPYHHE